MVYPQLTNGSQAEGISSDIQSWFSKDQRTSQRTFFKTINYLLVCPWKVLNLCGSVGKRKQEVLQFGITQKIGTGGY